MREAGVDAQRILRAGHDAAAASPHNLKMEQEEAFLPPQDGGAALHEAQGDGNGAGLGFGAVGEAWEGDQRSLLAGHDSEAALPLKDGVGAGGNLPAPPGWRGRSL